MLVLRVEVKLNVYQILVGKYKSVEHLGDEDYIKRQRIKRICACLD
jgi:predicted RNA-binding protein